MTGTKQSGSKGVIRIGSISLVLTGIALATTVAPLQSFAAGTKPLPIERIGLDNARQLVIQFAAEPGAFPSIPNVLDLPGPNHRVVVDFSDTTIDRAKIPTVDEIKTAMTKILPAINGIRYMTLPNAAKPTARIVLELPEDLKVTARVVKVEETSVTINLGEDVKNLVVPKKTTAKPNQSTLTPSSIPTTGADTTISAMTQTSAPIPSASAPAQPLRTAPVVISEPLEPVAAAPVESAPFVAAPVATAPVAVQTPVSVAAPPTTVTTTHYDTVAAPFGPAGQPVVSADGETVALKGEQKLEQSTAPAGATKSSTSATGWDWNSPVENELATKAAETKTMGEGAAVAAVPQLKDDAEEALIKKVAAKELGLAPAVVPVAPIASIETTPVAAAVEATPVAAVKEAVETAPVVQLREVDTTPVPTESPLTLPTEAPKAVVPAPVVEEAPEPQAEAAGPAKSLKLYNSAVRNHLSGKLMEAINDYKGALAANPSLAEAHSNLGLIYNQQHNYAGALGEFHKALAINPKDAITYNGIGAALRAEKDLPGAIKNWQTAVDIDPKLATAHYNLGTAFEIQKDYDRALEAYKDAVTNDYRLGEAYYRMGLILQQKHRLEDAEAQYKEALKVSASSEYSADAKQRLADLKTQKK
ncbi:hypothetical protein BH10CYA1_BH10CYA1_31800 [soil metagenome]